MADYRLEGLSTRSFEQLVQALAAKVIGPSIVVFGDGPDGGREATFEGPIPFPSKLSGWDGYGVVQAKFRQKPEGVHKDGDWLVKQLKGELDKFVSPRGARRKPQYYILATNVVLTPPAGIGYKDKLSATFRKYKRTLGLKAHSVWDNDWIRTQIDGNEDIRSSYSAWITAGDVLAEAMRRLRGSRPDFEETIALFLQKDLLADQYVNLGQADQGTRDRMLLARAFVDLPADSVATSEPDQEEGSSLAPGFVSEALIGASQRLDPASLEALPLSTRTPIESPIPGRFVLVGGPGQGKTTVAQFICQLFRAAILQKRPLHTLEEPTRETIRQLARLCAEEGIAFPSVRRFPIRVSLSELAKILADQDYPKVNSLLSYLIYLFGKKTERKLGGDDMRSWLGAHPWLLVLDGLDEVPASTNRAEVLAAIQDFFVDARSCGADLMVLATTRPQGYSDEFSARVYEHRYLTPLSVKRAMHYSKRLAEDRYGSDQERKKRLLQRLERAAREETTARLMWSPLQVTIMAALVDRLGQPPQGRYSLYKEYYKAVYARETERELPVAAILRSYELDVNVIHGRVGVLLQVESERTGKTDVRLRSDRFASVVKDWLAEQGHTGKDLEQTTQDITEAATKRLVLLVGLESGRVGFEIRSLQEYMAAEGLMTGSDDVVKARLREIAPIENWRNVFLLAAGKCFAETDKQHFRDTIETVCSHLNEDRSNVLLQRTLAGSRLALDLLEDGLASRGPKYARSLTRIATRLMDLPPETSHARLAGLCENITADIYQEEIGRRLGERDACHRLGAWACLSALVSRGTVWANKMAAENLPKASEDLYKLCRAASVVGATSALRQWLELATPFVGPKELRGVLPTTLTEPESDNTSVIGTSPPWLLAALRWGSFRAFSHVSVPLMLRGSTSKPAALSIVSFRNSEMQRFATLAAMPHPSTAWQASIRAIEFLQTPSRFALARFLRAFSMVSPATSESFYPQGLPWILDAPLRRCIDASALMAMADRVEAGHLGDLDDWTAAEERWKRQGVTEIDLLSVVDNSLPFNRDIAIAGFPLDVAGADWSPGLAHAIPQILCLHSKLRVAHHRSWLARLVVWTIALSGVLPAKFAPPAEDIAAVLETTDERPAVLADSTFLEILLASYPVDWAMTAVERIAHRFSFHCDVAVPVDLIGRFAQAYALDPSKTGLLRIISDLISSGSKTPGGLTGVSVGIPAPLVSPRRFDDPGLMRSAFLVSTVLDRLTEPEQIELVKQSRILVQESPEFASHILSVLKGSQHTWSNFAPSVIEEIWNTIPSDHCELVGQVIDVCRQIQRSRMSRMANRSVWASLGFSEGLIALLLALPKTP